MPDLLPVKYKASGGLQSDIYSYSTGVSTQIKTTQFGGAIITPETGYSYAPTNETNYYNGYEVPVGGYVMVSSNVDNTHSFYSFNDDNTLINFTNVTFGQNFSTIQNSLAYLFSATTWTVLNYNKPLIPFNYFTTNTISQGSYIEFGNTMCYPKTGDNIYELDGSPTALVAFNGPIFSGTTPGFFTFDGVDEYMQRNFQIITASRSTAQIWIRPRYLATKSVYEIFAVALRLTQTITNVVLTIKKTSDNNILFGGSVTNINGTNGNLFKCDSGFTLNVGFTPPILSGGNMTVKSIVESSSGKIYIGGSFDKINGTPVGFGLARLNSNGTLDSSFNVGSGFSGDGYTAEVEVIVEDSSGDLYVGGNFNFYSGQSYNKLIKLNSSGNIVTSFNIGNGIRTGTSSSSTVFVNDLALSSDGLRLYVGGEFTTYSSSTVNANRLVRILTTGGTIDNTFNMTTGVNNDVETLLLDSSENLYVAGQFTSVLGTAQNRIARITSGGTIDATFVVGTGFPSAVFRLRFNNSGKILVCSDATSYNGSTYQRLILLNTDGSIDTTLNTATGFNNDLFDCVQLSNGDIVAGGLYTQYKGVTRPQILRINNTGTYQASVTSLDGTNKLEFQPYNRVSGRYVSLYLFSGTNYDYFGGNTFANTTTNRNNIFNKWYLITTVNNTQDPPYDLYINGENVFNYTGGTTSNLTTYENYISAPTNAFLGDISEFLAKSLSALTNNDVSTYFNLTKSRHGY
jgi:hypothetical protein